MTLLKIIVDPNACWTTQRKPSRSMISRPELRRLKKRPRSQRTGDETFAPGQALGRADHPGRRAHLSEDKPTIWMWVSLVPVPASRGNGIHFDVFCTLAPNLMSVAHAPERDSGGAAIRSHRGLSFPHGWNRHAR